MTATLLADYTTLKVGGAAREFITATTREALIEATLDTWDSAEPWLLLGGGSNMVVSDLGFDGTVIHVATTGIERIQDASAAPNHSVVRVAVGITGMSLWRGVWQKDLRASKPCREFREPWALRPSKTLAPMARNFHPL